MAIKVTGYLQNESKTCVLQKRERKFCFSIYRNRHKAKLISEVLCYMAIKCELTEMKLTTKLQAKVTAKY